MKHVFHIISLVKISLFLGGLILIGFISGMPLCAEASTITPEKVLELVNFDRTAIGLPALIVNDQLTVAAEAKVRDMGEKHYFAHTSPEGKTPWSFIDAAGYSYHFAGENLAIRFMSAEDEQQAWLQSPTHRANILSNKFLETGIAVWMTEEDGQQVLIVAEEFGTKPGVAIATQPSSTVLPGEVAASVIEKTSVSMLPQASSTSSNVLVAKIVERVSSWTDRQLLIVLGLGAAEIVAVSYALHLLRKKRYGDDTRNPVSF